MRRARPSPASILQQVRSLRAQPIQVRMAQMLDALDAWRALESALRTLPRLHAWGPKAISGLLPMPWVGVVIWRRGGGYTGYKTLLIVGVWAQQTADGAHVIVGHKPLPFSAPFYEAESYHKLMRDGFDVYYQDDGSPPPPASRALDIAYTEGERLALRTSIRTAVGAILAAPPVEDDE